MDCTNNVSSLEQNNKALTLDLKALMAEFDSRRQILNRRWKWCWPVWKVLYFLNDIQFCRDWDRLETRSLPLPAEPFDTLEKLYAFFDWSANEIRTMERRHLPSGLMIWPVSKLYEIWLARKYRRMIASLPDETRKRFIQVLEWAQEHMDEQESQLDRSSQPQLVSEV